MNGPASPNEEKNPFELRPDIKGGIWLLVLGVALPLAALVTELQFRCCAQSFFDPFPSDLHAFLFGLIPLSTALILFGVRKDLSEHYVPFSVLNGMASGIALTYALMLLPLLTGPFFVMLTCKIEALGGLFAMNLPRELGEVILLFSIGFGIAASIVWCTPLIAIFTTHKAGTILCKLARTDHANLELKHAQHLGHVFVILTVVAVELPSTLTRLHLAMTSDPSRASEEINWLRKHGDQEVLLRACYERSGRATDILGSIAEIGHPPNIDHARRIFYLVTGKPFNTVPIPLAARATMQHAHVTIDGHNVQDEFDVDTDLGGENVSSGSRGLAATQTELTGKINSTLATARLCWTLHFQNTSQFKREARAKIKLPTGGVITKASLTLDGSPMDATMLPRQSARHIYQSSLRDENHPLLVSVSGPDQVLMQCYPIYPHSSSKVELEIVAPVRVESAQVGSLEIPSFSEKNFLLPMHNIVSIPNAYLSSGKEVTPGTDNCCLLSFPINLQSTPDTSPVTIMEKKTVPPRKLIVLVDGSASLSPVKHDIASGLLNLPKQVEGKLLVACDQDTQTAPTEPFLKAVSRLDSLDFIGGHDNTSKLFAACTKAAKEPLSVVLWIHGPQPISPKQKESIKNLVVSASKPLLYDLQLTSGPNEALNDIYFARGLCLVAKYGSVKKDLTELFREWESQSIKYQAHYPWSAETSVLDAMNACNDADLRILATAEKTFTDCPNDTESICMRQLASLCLNVVTPQCSAILTYTVKRNDQEYWGGSLTNPDSSGASINSNLPKEEIEIEPYASSRAYPGPRPNIRCFRSAAETSFEGESLSGNGASSVCIGRLIGQEGTGGPYGAAVDPRYGQSSCISTLSEDNSSHAFNFVGDGMRLTSNGANLWKTIVANILTTAVTVIVMFCSIYFALKRKKRA